MRWPRHAGPLPGDSGRRAAGLAFDALTASTGIAASARITTSAGITASTGITA